MCRGLVRMRAFVQGSTGSRDYGNPGSAPGTLGCEVLGLYEYGTLGSSDCDDLGGFGSLSGLLIPLQQFSGGVC